MTRVEVFTREDGKFDWRMIGANGEVMAGSVQGYEREAEALAGWVRVKDAAVKGVEVRFS